MMRSHSAAERNAGRSSTSVERPARTPNAVRLVAADRAPRSVHDTGWS